MKKIMSIFLSCIILLGTISFTVNADNNFKVNGVGVLDASPRSNFVDFGDTLLWQAAFNEMIYGYDDLPEEPGKLAIYAQGKFGDYIVINGKTVNQWNTEDYNCVTIHIAQSDALGGYLEFHTKKSEGLISADTENYVTFLSGFPSASGATLSQNMTYYLAKGSTSEFELVDSSRAVIPQIPNESEIEFDVRAIGILDQPIKKPLHDFGSSYLWQIDFTKDFYDEASLGASGRKDHVQSEIGDYIIINGKSVTDWNLDVFNSVQIHVVKNETFGQYLEMNTNSIIGGLIDETTDNTVTILQGFPLADGTTMSKSVSYSLPANSTALFQRLDTVVDTVEVDKKAEEKEPVETLVKEEQEFTILSEKGKTINDSLLTLVGASILCLSIVVSALIIFSNKSKGSKVSKGDLNENTRI